MKSEFDDFLNSENVTPPRHISKRIISKIAHDLTPSRLAIFRKLALIQFLTGFVTLSFCPQLGLGFTQSMGLMGMLMKYGENICMAGCGAIFLGLSSLAAVIFLRPEEMRVLKQSQAVQFPILAVATLGVFICFGAPVLSLMGVSWFVGSIAGSLLTFDVALRIKTALV